MNESAGWMRRILASRLAAVILASTIVAVVLSVAAYAVSTQPTIHAAYNSTTGALRLFTTSRPKLLKGERAIGWPASVVNDSAAAAAFWPQPVSFALLGPLTDNGLDLHAPSYHLRTVGLIAREGSATVANLHWYAVLHLPSGNVPMYQIDDGGRADFHLTPAQNSSLVLGQPVPVEYWAEWGGVRSHETSSVLVGSGPL